MPKNPDGDDTSQQPAQDNIADQLMQLSLERAQAKRAAKKPLAGKHRRVSSDTISVLTRLDESIAAATKHLKKLPGAREPEARVSVDSVFADEECHTYHEAFYLEFFEGVIHVCYEYTDHPDHPERFIYKTLDKYNTTTRIKLCGYIPDLIAAAKAAEEKVREAAEDVIARIEQAIAESMEVVE